MKFLEKYKMIYQIALQHKSLQFVEKRFTIEIEIS